MDGCESKQRKFKRMVDWFYVVNNNQIVFHVTV